LENRRSKDEKMSITIWEVVEAKAGEVRTAETEGRRREREREREKQEDKEQKRRNKKNLKRREQCNRRR